MSRTFPFLPARTPVPFLTVMVLILPGTGWGQEVIEPPIASTRRVLPAWMAGTLSFHVAPQIQFRAGGFLADASALLGGARRQPSRLEAQAGLAFGVPAISALRFETEVGAFRTGGGADIRSRGIEGTFRLIRQDQGGMAWIGGTLASSWDDATTRRARTLLGGAWKTLGATGFGLSIRAVEYDEEIVFGRDTTYHLLGFPFVSRRTTQIVYDHYYIDAELVASRQLGPVALHVDWGWRLTRRAVTEPRTWFRGGLEVPVLHDVTLQIAAGKRPTIPEYRIEAGSFATVGVKLELGKGAWPVPTLEPEPPYSNAPTTRLRALGEADTWELLILNVPGQRIEIMGDPTNWDIVQLDPLGQNDWRVALRLPPGTYRVNMRVDGRRWRALPGYPTTVDEFGGIVGVIVIDP